MKKLLSRAGTGPRGGTVWMVFCPGCKCGHPFEVDCPKGDGWTWNGSKEKPTFAPSLLCNASFPESRCHCFVREGRIEFLSDCYHSLAGQTVDLPDWETRYDGKKEAPDKV